MHQSKIDWEKFEAIAKSKKLSIKEDAMLLNEIRKGDQLAIYKLVDSWESIILSVAKQVAIQYSNENITIEKMIDAGRKELIKLCRKEIGNTRREQFSRFGGWVIRQSILALIAKPKKKE